MTKREACALLGISPKTLQRRMSKGVYTFTRTGEGHYAELSFTHADLGLTEPAPVPEPTPVLETAPAAPEPTPEPAPTFAPTPLGPIELKEQADRRFADDYKRGLVGDSAGNKIDGTNEKWPTKGAQSLLGPVESTQAPAIDLQAHMDPALLGKPSGERWSFDKGLDDATLTAMRSDWRRRGGGQSMSQQRETIERSKAAINAAFPRAQ